MAELAKWGNFYTMVGSAAGALIGLQFVVITLIANRPSAPRSREAGAAFATPSIVHLGTALLLSALLLVPWPSISGAASSCELVGLAGVLYALIVARRMRRQTAYQPEFEDWLFHFLLPLASYAGLALSALMLISDARDALFGFGTATMVLLFAGIHNAWDAVTYHVYSSRPDQP